MTETCAGSPGLPVAARDARASGLPGGGVPTDDLQVDELLAEGLLVDVSAGDLLTEAAGVGVEAAGLAVLGRLAAAEARLFAAVAEQLQACAVLSRRLEGVDGPERFLVLDVAGTLRTGQLAASARLAEAERLVADLPLLLAGLRRAQVLVPQARVVLEETRSCAPAVVGEVERRLLASGIGSWTARRLRTRTKALVLQVEAELDPAATGRRGAAARAGRRVGVRPEPDGMASLWALLPAEQARAFTVGLDELTRRQALADRAAGIGRTADQRRADVLATLPALALHALDGTAAPVAADGACSHPRVVVEVSVPVATALGLSHAPGDLVGYGPISAEHVRLLLPDAELRRVLVDATTGEPLPTPTGRATSRPHPAPRRRGRRRVGAGAAAAADPGRAGRARADRRARLHPVPRSGPARPNPRPAVQRPGLRHRQPVLRPGPRDPLAGRADLRREPAPAQPPLPPREDPELAHRAPPRRHDRLDQPHRPDLPRPTAVAPTTPTPAAPARGAQPAARHRHLGHRRVGHRRVGHRPVGRRAPRAPPGHTRRPTRRRRTRAVLARGPGGGRSGQLETRTHTRTALPGRSWQARPMPARPPRDLALTALVAVWVLVVLGLDTGASLGQQRLLGLGTWLLLLALLRGQSRATRTQVGVVVVFASVIEYVFAGWLGVYVYRLENVPAFVPPGHGLIYLAALCLGRSAWARRRARPLTAATLLAGGAWAVWGLTLSPRPDALGAFWFGCLLVFTRYGRSPLLYASAFLVVSYLEIVGTSLGTWAWQPYDPTGLVSIGNPPSGIAGGYAWFDAAALAATPWLLARLPGRRRPGSAVELPPPVELAVDRGERVA